MSYDGPERRAPRELDDYQGGCRADDAPKPRYILEKRPAIGAPRYVMEHAPTGTGPTDKVTGAQHQHTPEQIEAMRRLHKRTAIGYPASLGPPATGGPVRFAKWVPADYKTLKRGDRVRVALDPTVPVDGPPRGDEGLMDCDPTEGFERELYAIAWDVQYEKNQEGCATIMRADELEVLRETVPDWAEAQTPRARFDETYPDMAEYVADMNALADAGGLGDDDYRDSAEFDMGYFDDPNVSVRDDAPVERRPDLKGAFVQAWIFVEDEPTAEPEVTR